MRAARQPASWGREVEQLVGEHYESSKSPVLAKVTRKLRGHDPPISIDRLDLEAAYNTAWHQICRHKANGGAITSLDGLIVAATYRLALNIHRGHRDAYPVAEEVEQHADRTVDLAQTIDDRVLLGELFARLASRLNVKERKGIVLCLLYGYSRPEAARALGIREPAFQKIMDRAMKKLESVIAGIRTRGCDDQEWAQAIRSYALGSLSQQSPDYERVRAHLQLCPDCRRYATSLEGLALLPPLGAPLLPFAHHPGGLAARLGKLLSGSRHGLSGSAGSQTAAASRAGSGGMASLLGGTAAKTAAIVAAAAAGVAAATVPALSSHASTHHTLPTPAHAVGVTQSTSTVRPTKSTQRYAGKTTTRRHTRTGEKTPSATGRRRGRRPVESESAQSEFGFERTTTPPAPATTQSTQPAAAASSENPTQAAESEFGIEGPNK